MPIQTKEDSLLNSFKAIFYKKSLFIQIKPFLELHFESNLSYTSGKTPQPSYFLVT